MRTRTLLAIALCASTWATSSRADITLARDPTDSLANAPHVERDTLSNAERARVNAALALARPELKTRARYKQWQTTKQSYDTHVGLLANGHVAILFAPPLVTDQEIMMDVDVATRAVKVSLGMG